MDKMTRKEALSLAISALTDNTEAVEVLTKMVDALNRKTPRNTDSKPTANQLENESIKQEIVALLSVSPMTIPQLMESITVDTAKALTSQRISALLTQLKRSGEVVRSEGKDAIFALATPISEEESVEEE